MCVLTLPSDWITCCYCSRETWVDAGTRQWRLLGRTIFLLKPPENIAIFPFYAPRVVQMVVLYDESFSSLFVPQTRYLLPPKTHSNGSCAALWGKFHSKIIEDAKSGAARPRLGQGKDGSGYWRWGQLFGRLEGGKQEHACQAQWNANLRVKLNCQASVLLLFC